MRLLGYHLDQGAGTGRLELTWDGGESAYDLTDIPAAQRALGDLARAGETGPVLRIIAEAIHRLHAEEKY